MSDGDNYPCPHCGQYIFKSTTRYNSKGWALKINLNTGDGGLRGEEHICPKKPRVKHHDSVDMRTCDQCHARYNLDKYPMCPTCFKLLCTGCGEIWVATRFNVAEKRGLYVNIRRCPKCGKANPELTFDKDACEKMRAVVAINNR